MLPKSKRLNLKKDFKWVVKGTHLQSTNFKLFYRLGDDSAAKVGISLSKQYFKKAVDRNLARRKMSEVVQSQFLTLKPNLNLIIMPKDGVTQTSREDLTNEFKNVIMKNLSQENKI